MYHIPPYAISLILEALEAIFQKKHFADKALRDLFKKHRIQDEALRGFVADTTYEVVRWYRLLAFAIGKEPEWTEDWIQLVGAWMVKKGKRLSKFREFDRFPKEETEQQLKKAAAFPAILRSFPDWLDALGQQELGEQWPAIAGALNRRPETVLRVNTLKTTREGLQKALAQEKIASKPLGEEALLVPEAGNLFATQAFRNGLFEMQDFASQQIVPLLDVKPGHLVVDACAGFGGKTLHLAAHLQNKGRLLALDTQPHKLEELRRRARKAGAQSLETRTIDTTKVIKRLAGKADRVLLDVPCTGTGVIRRNPDAKWRLAPEDVPRLIELQREILLSYSRMVKPGGKLVYATCSIFPSENEQQVQAFLEEKGNDFELLKMRHWWPHEDGFDGFFGAVFQRKNVSAKPDAPEEEQTHTAADQ